MLLIYIFALLVVNFSVANSDETYPSNSDVNKRNLEKELVFGLFKNVGKQGKLLWKRDTVPGGETEGGEVIASNKVQEAEVKPQEKQNAAGEKTPEVKVNATTSNNTIAATTMRNEAKSNATLAQKALNQMDLSNPGVLKRGGIVFGGFALLAVAYFIFYRRKGKNSDTNNSHNVPDAVQFRYGVLKSNERDNMELSRVPLTMDSEDEDDDDLEIFDLEQRKKSLSYVNLKTQSDDMESFSILNDDSQNDNERNNLLLDIDDADTLINLTGSNSKSIS